MKQILVLILLIFTFFIQNSLAQENEKVQAIKEDDDTKNISNEQLTPKSAINFTSTKNQINNKINDLTAGAKALANGLLEKSEKIKKSLMFNDKEIKDVNDAMNSFKNNQEYTPEDQTTKTETVAVAEKQENVRAYIYLASILYMNENNWTVWIGDKKITNKTNKKDNEIYIISLDSGQVSVLWSLSISKWKILFGVENDDLVPKTNEQNQIETRFTLRPNQTFVLNHNKVFEGKITPDNKSKTSEKTQPNKTSEEVIP